MQTAKPLFFGASIYRTSSYGAGHPLSIPRVSTVIDLCRSLDWLPPEVYVTNPMAKPAALEIWHDADYLAALQQAEATLHVSDADRKRYKLGTVSNPVFPEMYKRPATSAGGSLLAGEYVAKGACAFHPAGGTHHGMPDHANGFCYLNDPVMAILSLKRHGMKRVAYVDIDAHYCDGVVRGFAHDPDVLVVSIHQENLWPRNGAVEVTGVDNVMNLPVPDALNDTEFRCLIDDIVIPRVMGFAPDAIVVQCGADAIKEDPQSRLNLSNNAHVYAVRQLRLLQSRFLALGGGGYNPWSVARAWTRIWAELNGFDVPGTLPPKAEAILRAIQWTNNTRGKNPPQHWFTTLKDAPREGAVRDGIKRLANGM
jgi:acetoin utilization protein AcuC